MRCESRRFLRKEQPLDKQLFLLTNTLLHKIGVQWQRYLFSLFQFSYHTKEINHFTKFGQEKRAKNYLSPLSHRINVIALNAHKFSFFFSLFFFSPPGLMLSLHFRLFQLVVIATPSWRKKNTASCRVFSNSHRINIEYEYISLR